MWKKILELEEKGKVGPREKCGSYEIENTNIIPKGVNESKFKC